MQDNHLKTREYHGASAGQERARRGYGIWAGIKQRCANPSCVNYAKYGGRGITMHKAWADSFAAFIEDVGERPSLKHTIDRFPDPNGNYEPGNVRWATYTEQNRHLQAQSTNSTKITGVTVCFRRLANGWKAYRARLGSVCLGYYATLEEAVAARKTAEAEHWLDPLAHDVDNDNTRMIT